MSYYSTRATAKLLAMHPSRLARAVWDGRVAPPSKSPSGAFLWTLEDVRRASWVMLHRDLDDVLAEKGGGRD